jgi:hypothetical protein
MSSSDDTFSTFDDALVLLARELVAGRVVEIAVDAEADARLLPVDLHVDVGGALRDRVEEHGVEQRHELRVEAILVHQVPAAPAVRLLLLLLELAELERGAQARHVRGRDDDEREALDAEAVLHLARGERGIGGGHDHAAVLHADGHHARLLDELARELLRELGVDEREQALGVVEADAPALRERAIQLALGEHAALDEDLADPAPARLRGGGRALDVGAPDHPVVHDDVADAHAALPSGGPGALPDRHSIEAGEVLHHATTAEAGGGKRATSVSL